MYLSLVSYFIMNILCISHGTKYISDILRLLSFLCKIFSVENVSAIHRNATEIRRYVAAARTKNLYDFYSMNEKYCFHRLYKCFLLALINLAAEFISQKLYVFICSSIKRIFL